MPSLRWRHPTISCELINLLLKFKLQSLEVKQVFFIFLWNYPKLFSVTVGLHAILSCQTLVWKYRLLNMIWHRSISNLNLLIPQVPQVPQYHSTTIMDWNVWSSDFSHHVKEWLLKKLILSWAFFPGKHARSRCQKMAYIFLAWHRFPHSGICQNGFF